MHHEDPDTAEQQVGQEDAEHLELATRDGGYDDSEHLLGQELVLGHEDH